VEVSFSDAHSHGFHSDSIVLLVRLLGLAGFKDSRKDLGNELQRLNVSVPHKLNGHMEASPSNNGQVIRRSRKSGDLGEKQCLSGFKRATRNVDE
jgi:hypothetical protein